MSAACLSDAISVIVLACSRVSRLLSHRRYVAHCSTQRSGVNDHMAHVCRSEKERDILEWL